MTDAATGAPALGAPALGSPATTVLDVEDLVQHFTITAAGIGKRVIQAVSGVSLMLRRGETLTLVGESGCGKSSLARAILQEPPPKSGRVTFEGRDLTSLRGKELQEARLGMQAVFQDPYGSLDPRWSIRSLIGEPLSLRGVKSKEERDDRVDELLDAVGLDPRTFGRRRPRELSGGQCQRVAIARALALGPSLLVCDEATSSLDVSVQAQIINLFERFRRDLGLSYLFITHDLAIAKHVSDRLAIMYLGKLVEIGDSTSIFAAPAHPYTDALLSSMPDSEQEVAGQAKGTELSGELPSAADPPSGCRFRTRCPLAQDVCATEEPPLAPIREGQSVACHFPLAPLPTSPASPGGAREGAPMN